MDFLNHLYLATLMSNVIIQTYSRPFDKRRIGQLKTIAGDIMTTASYENHIRGNLQALYRKGKHEGRLKPELAAYIEGLMTAGRLLDAITYSHLEEIVHDEKLKITSHNPQTPLDNRVNIEQLTDSELDIPTYIRLEIDIDGLGQ